MRLSDHPDAPLVEVKWFFTHKPFQETETVFGSSIYADHYDDDPRLGEVKRPNRNLPYSSNKPIRGFDTDHQCGEPEWFSEGFPWPYDGPPILLDGDSIPLCCERSQVPDVSSAARPAGELLNPVFPVVGVSSAARPAGELLDPVFPVVGVSSAARPAGELLDPVFPVVGVSSAARPSAELLDPVYPVVGVASGARPDNEVNGGPPEVETCDTSHAMEIGTTVARTFLSAGTHWYVFPPLTAGLYHISYSVAAGTVSFLVSTGPCNDLVSVAVDHDPGCIPYLSDGTTEVHLSATGTEAAEYFLTLETGPCGG